MAITEHEIKNYKLDNFIIDDEWTERKNSSTEFAHHDLQMKIDDKLSKGDYSNNEVRNLSHI